MARRGMRGYGRRRPREVARYTQRTLHHDRQYGFYWYSALWRLLRPVLSLLCALVIVAGVVFTGINGINKAFFMAVEPGNKERVDFVIDPGSSVTTIGRKLEEEGLIRNSGIFRYIIQFQGLTSKIQYGSYPLSRDMNVNQVIDALCQGSATNERTITIIPGWTVADIASYLKAQGAIDNEGLFLNLCTDLDKFVDLSYSLQAARDSGLTGQRRYQLEGYLAPDTYRIYLNATPESIIQTLLKQNEAVVDKVFNTQPVKQVVRDEFGNIITDALEAEAEQEVAFVTTLTPDETLILASIIEKEAARKADYAKVSAVFHNRLERGMRLESDATVAYPLGIKRMVLTSDEISTPNGYNTYMKDGLPVGPICNPSQAALEAALYPDTEYIYDGYLYFCAGDPNTGELVFSRTQQEHQANVVKYRPLWLAHDQQIQ